MSAVPLVVTAVGAVSAAGVGAAPTAAAGAASGTAAPSDVSGLYAEPMPYEQAYAVPGFDVRALLGRKGTSFLDRGTGLVLVAAREALEAGTGAERVPATERTGVVLGTTVGSLRSSTDYSRETLTADRPYLVQPALFPNTVLNGAAGQTAIRYRLRGVNATVATGRLAFVGALRYAANTLRRGYADAMVVGAFEELTPATAWTHRRLDRPGLPGEGAAVLVVRPGEAVPPGADPPVAEILAAAEGFHPGGGDGYAERLAACLRGALDRAGCAADEVGFVAATEGWDAADEQVGADALAGAGLGGVRRIRVRDRLGDCAAAAGALQLVAALTAPSGDAAVGTGVLVAWSPEGAHGVVVVRSGHRAGADRRRR